VRKRGFDKKPALVTSAVGAVVNCATCYADGGRGACSSRQREASTSSRFRPRQLPVATVSGICRSGCNGQAVGLTGQAPRLVADDIVNAGGHRRC